MQSDQAPEQWFPSKAALFTKADRVASLPATAQLVLSEVAKANSNAARLADLLAKDPPLAKKVAAVANSAFYGRGAKATTLQQAVGRIGTSEVRNIVLNASLLDMFGLEHKQLGRLYLEALIGALATEHILAVATAVPRQGKDNLFYVGALLRDIGWFVLNQVAPTAYTKLVALLERTEAPRIEVERTVLGYTHTEVGAALLLKWKLPSAEVDACRWHHTPVLAPEVVRYTAHMVHLADCVSRGVLAKTLEETLRKNVNDKTRKTLGIDDAGWKQLVDTGDVLLSKAQEFESLLASDS